MAKTKIAVIGASSMVGSRFCELAEADFDLIKADLNGENQIDITSEESVDNFFKNNLFDIAFLLSAYTDVEGAQKQKNDKNGSCWKINVDGTKNVAEACQKFQRKLIFISTDFVFDGVDGPSEEDKPTQKDFEKISWYGASKVEAEKIIQKLLPDSIIIRIAYPYRNRYDVKDDIAKRFLKLYRDQKMYPVFTDQVITPTFIDDLSPAVKLLVEKGAKGIFHVASPKVTTQYDFAKKTIEIFGGDPNAIPKGSILELLKNPGATPRPVKGGLKTDKIQSLGFVPTGWDKGIEIIHEQSEGKLI